MTAEEWKRVAEAELRRADAAEAERDQLRVDLRIARADVRRATAMLEQLTLQARGDDIPGHSRDVAGCRCGNTRLADELAFARSVIEKAKRK